MKTHISIAIIGLALLLTACFGQEPGTDSTDAGRNATDTNEVALGDTETQPSDKGAPRSEQTDMTGDSAGAASDAGEPANDTGGSDTGDADSDAGNDARPGCDAGIDRTPDAGTPDTPSPALPYIFETEEHGVLVETDEDTTVTSASAPEWSTQTIGSAEFERPDGETYTVLIYTREPGEAFADWMRRAEVGDAFVSTRMVETSDEHTGYVYETNDLAAIPAVHVTVPTENFVYYFHTDEESFEVPEDFLNFIGELELQ